MAVYPLKEGDLGAVASNHVPGAKPMGLIDIHKMSVPMFPQGPLVSEQYDWRGVPPAFNPGLPYDPSPTLDHYPEVQLAIDVMMRDSAKPYPPGMRAAAIAVRAELDRVAGQLRERAREVDIALEKQRKAVADFNDLYARMRELLDDCPTAMPEVTNKINAMRMSSVEGIDPKPPTDESNEDSKK